MNPPLTQWNETEPPQDGQPLVLCGGVMVHDEFSVSKVPFTVVAYWDAAAKDWLRWQDGLSLRRAPEDEVIVHFWMPYPMAGAGDRPAHHFNYVGVED